MVIWSTRIDRCLCWPLKITGYLFRDIVSGKGVYQGICQHCGKIYMTGGRWQIFKVRRL